MLRRKDIGIINLLILFTFFCFSFGVQFALAKFGETPPTPGRVKCCFGTGSGQLSGQCLEMIETECILKRGAIVGNCAACKDWAGETRPVLGKVRCCFGKGGGHCMEMTGTDCKLKRGMVVPDCKQCQGK